MFGGGIGVRVTGVVARVLMDVWSDKLSRILNNDDVTLLLITKYVDDINMVLRKIPEGYCWVPNQEHTCRDTDLKLEWS